MDSVATYFSILLPAFLAGILVLLTHVPMGQEVLKRGIIFLDLAIAQTAALGVIVAGSVGMVASHGAQMDYLTQGIAMLSAVVVASSLYYCRHFEPRIQEALIGIIFILASTGSYLFVTGDAHGIERMKAVLVGQILWVTTEQLVFTLSVYLVVLTIFYLFKDRLNGFMFYPLFAVTVTLSTQLVGVYLVFASLIVPSLVAMLFSNSYLIAWLTGLLAYLIGLVCSSVFDLPSGPLIAWCMAALGLGMYLIKKLMNNFYDNPYNSE
ncbi:MAG: zinc/manganese transport system permease protein [Oleiphilaceae bacterium]|jgi:zinc/manganese transport system permease protein